MANLYLQSLKSSEMKKWLVILLLSLALILLVSPVGLYVYQFAYWHNHTWFDSFNLSDDKDIWAKFGDFLNVWVSLSSLTILSMLTYYIHSIDKNREDFRNRPLLIYKRDVETGKWKIKNIGNGAALNIIHSDTNDENVWDNNLDKFHSLMSGEDFILEYPSTGKIMCAVYYDIHGKVYSSLCKDEDTKISIGEDRFKNMDKSKYRSLEVLIAIKNWKFNQR